MPPRPDPSQQALPPITIRPTPPPSMRPNIAPNEGVPKEIKSLTDIYLRGRHIQALAGDPTALAALKWDNVEERVQPDGTREVVGFDAATGMSAVLRTETEAEEEPQGPTLAEQYQEGADLDYGDMGVGALAAVQNSFYELGRTLGYKDLTEWLTAKTGLEYDALQPQTIEGHLVEGVGRGAVGLAAASRIVPAKAFDAIGGFLRWTVTGAIADFTFFSEDDPGVAGALEELGELDDETLEAARSIFVEALGKDKDDSWVEKKLKNVGEGFLIGVTGDTLISFFRAARALQKSPATHRFLRDESGAGPSPFETISRLFPNKARVASGKPNKPGKPVTSPGGGRFLDRDDLTAQALKGLGVEQAELHKIWREVLEEGGERVQAWVQATGAAPKDLGFWNRSVRLNNRARYWYEISTEKLREVFPDLSDADIIKFFDILAATSAQADPHLNISRAIGTFSQWKRGVMIDVDLINDSAVRRAISDEDLTGPKTGSFSGTFRYLLGLDGTPPLSVNDRQVASAFGVDGNDIANNNAAYEGISNFYLKLRDAINRTLPEGAEKVETWQLQAMGWVQERIEKGNPSQDDYVMAVERFIDKLRAAEIEVPDGKITDEVLLDPDLEHVASTTLADYRASAISTMETVTTQDPRGRRAAAVLKAAREQGHQPTINEYRQIAESGVRRLITRRKELGGVSPAELAYQAVMGTSKKLSRLVRGEGSFEGVLSPNARIPLPLDMTDDQIDQFLSLLGRGLKQDASVASRFGFVKHDAEVAEGLTRTMSVIVPGLEEMPEATKQALMAALPEGHEVNIKRLVNGTVIDVNPRFTDEGQVGVTREEIDAAVVASMDPATVRIGHRDFKSYYHERNDYTKHIRRIKAGALNAEAAKIADIFGGKRDLARRYLRGDAELGPEVSRHRSGRAESARVRYRARVGRVDRSTQVTNEVSETLLRELGDFNNKRASKLGVEGPGFFKRFLTEEGGGGPNPFELDLFGKPRGDADPFFSKALRVVQGLSTEKAPPDQWRATLKNAGVKEEELAWAGLDDFLEGKKSVSRQELEAHLEANQVDIRDITRGQELEDVLNADELEEWARLRELQNSDSITYPEASRLDDLESRTYMAGLTLQERRQVEQLQAISPEERSMAQQQLLTELRDKRVRERGTEFEQYTLPGGERYRELLLTMPQRAAPDFQSAATITLLEDGRFRIEAPGFDAEAPLFNTRAEAERWVRRFVRRVDVSNFTQGHFSESNVLAHVRYNEREAISGKWEVFDPSTARVLHTVDTEAEAIAKTDTNELLDYDQAGAERVLFIEEIQSDWHQKARTLRKKAVKAMSREKGISLKEAAKEVPADVGYTSAKRQGVLVEEIQKGEARVIELRGEARNAENRHAAINRKVSAALEKEATTTHDLRSTAYHELQKKAVEALKEVRERRRNLDNAQQALEGLRREARKLGSVPDAPFKTTWPELAFKRMVRHAASKGFHKLAWTTGQQQADRYDLSKQVDSVEIEQRPSGKRLVKVTKDGNPILEFKYNEEDGVITGGRDEFIGKELDEVLGKELAEKVMGVQTPSGPGFHIVNKHSGHKSERFESREAAEAFQAEHPIDWSNTVIVKRIENSGDPIATFEGLDLKIGGEGMKAFYDKQLVRFANKFGKKFKAKVGRVSIGQEFSVMDDSGLLSRWPTRAAAEHHAQVARQTRGSEVRVITSADEFEIVQPSGFVESTHLTREDAENTLRNMRENTGAALPEYTIRKGNPSGIEAHSIDITPKMRATAMEEGFPLFSAGGAAAAIASQGAQEPRGEETQVAGMIPIKQLIEALVRGKAGREALKNPPKPKVPPKPPGVDEILEVYKPYKSQSLDIEDLDFNMQNLETSAGAKQVINEVSKAYEAKITSRVGGVEGRVVPLEVTRQIADLLGTDPDSADAAIKNLPSDVAGLHVRALTMRDMLVASAEQVDRLAYKLAQDPTAITDGDRIAFYEQMARHSALQANMKGVQTEIARALSAFRIPAEAPPMARAQMVQEVLRGEGGNKKAEELAQLWLQTPVEKRGALATESWRAKTVGSLRELWINGLLSGFRTHQLNFIGNQIFTAWQIPERLVASGFGTARRAITGSKEGVRPAEAAALILGLVEGFPDAVRLGWGTFKTGEPSSNLTKLEHMQHQNITAVRWNLDEHSLPGRFVDLVGMGVRIPSRFLVSADEFQKGLGRSMERRAIAFRLSHEALAKGGSLDDASRIYADTLAGTHAPAEELVQDFADTITYTRRLGEAGQSVQNMVRRVPMAWLLAPFVRTPANIMKEVGKRTPAAALWPGASEVRADLAAGGARADLAMARISTGTAAMAWAAHLAGQGHITGGGPSDTRMRQIWLQEFSPYSVKIGDKWYPYGRLEPIGMLFGIAADYVDYQKWAPKDLAEESAETLAGAAVGSILHRIGGKAFFSGISEFAKAYEDPERYAERYVQRMAGSFMPFSTMVRDIESAGDPARSDTRQQDPYEKDPFVRQWRAILNELKSRTPGMAADLPARLDLWGNEVVAYEGSWVNSFNLLAPRSDKAQRIDKELLRLGYPMSMPPRKALGVRLTPWQYHTMVKAMNDVTAPDPRDRAKRMNLRAYLSYMVTAPLYLAQLSDQAKINMLRKVRGEFLTAAQQRMLTPGTEEFDAQLYSDVPTARILAPFGQEIR